MPSARSTITAVRRLARFVAVSSFGVLLVLRPAAAVERLPIPPVHQQTPVWCWAAVGEMVLRYFDYPSISPVGNYQCGLVGSLGGGCWSNCGACVTSIGSAPNLMAALANYQELADKMLPHDGQPFWLILESALGPEEIVDLIDDGRPVIAGISPSGNGWYYPPGLSEHVALIVGYRYEDDADVVLVVNDPMPYALATPFDPYLAAGGQRAQNGQYLIPYENFVDMLGYKDTILVD